MVPIALVVLPFGLGFGVAAREAGLSATEAIVMSATVFAAACQFAALDLWGGRIPLLPLVLLVLAVNARHILMGAALYPWLRGLTPAGRHLSVMVLTDANFASGLADYKAGERDFGLVVGGGIVLWLGWVAGTAGGVLAGDSIDDPRAYALDVVMIAFFAALLAGSWKGARTALPWTAAAVVAVGCDQFITGGWHVILGALAGGIVGGFTNGD